MINAKYTLGRNTGNTFQQTYKDSTVLGVPIAGPYVGTNFPTEDYVAVPIGDHELYVTWLDPSTYAIVDVFVMNFRPTPSTTSRPAAPPRRAPARSRSSRAARTGSRSPRHLEV